MNETGRTRPGFRRAVEQATPTLTGVEPTSSRENEPRRPGRVRSSASKKSAVEQIQPSTAETDAAEQPADVAGRSGPGGFRRPAADVAGRSGPGGFRRPAADVAGRSGPGGFR